MSDNKFNEFCEQYSSCLECPLSGIPTGCRETFSVIYDFLKAEPKED